MLFANKPNALTAFGFYIKIESISFADELKVRDNTRPKPP
jgi:hypothetical protein